MSVLLRFDVISTSRETIRLDDFDFDCIPRIVKDIMMNVMWDLEKRGHAAAGQMDSEDAMFLKRIRQRGYRLDDLKWICIKKTPPVKRGANGHAYLVVATDRHLYYSMDLFDRQVQIQMSPDINNVKNFLGEQQRPLPPGRLYPHTVALIDPEHPNWRRMTLTQLLDIIINRINRRYTEAETFRDVMERLRFTTQQIDHSLNQPRELTSARVSVARGIKSIINIRLPPKSY